MNRTAGGGNGERKEGRREGKDRSACKSFVLGMTTHT